MNPHIESTTAAVAATVAGAGAVLTHRLELGLPLPALLAAFAGAALILSFLAPQRDEAGVLLGVWRKAATVAFCTLAGTWLGPALAGLVGLEHVGLGAAFATGALGQLAVPALVARRAAIADWIMSLLPGSRGRGGQ